MNHIDTIIVEDEDKRFLASASYDDTMEYYDAKNIIKLRFPASHNWQFDDEYQIITVFVNRTDYNSHDSVRTAFAELLNAIDALSIKVNNFIDVL